MQPQGLVPGRHHHCLLHSDTAAGHFYGQEGDFSAGHAVLSSAMQVLTPAVTLAICALFGLEKLTSSLLISIFMITAGTGAATAVEVGVAGFKWMGFLSFLVSVLMEAVRVVYIQLLLGKLNYNAMEVRTRNMLLLSVQRSKIMSDFNYAISSAMSSKSSSKSHQCILPLAIEHQQCSQRSLCGQSVLVRLVQTDHFHC